jgi:hypothetical protein
VTLPFPYIANSGVQPLHGTLQVAGPEYVVHNNSTLQVKNYLQPLLAKHLLLRQHNLARLWGVYFNHSITWLCPN